MGVIIISSIPGFFLGLFSPWSINEKGFWSVTMPLAIIAGQVVMIALK